LKITDGLKNSFDLNGKIERNITQIVANVIVLYLIGIMVNIVARYKKDVIISIMLVIV
jgi:hypothetical protein